MSYIFQGITFCDEALSCSPSYQQKLRSKPFRNNAEELEAMQRSDTARRLHPAQDSFPIAKESAGLLPVTDDPADSCCLEAASCMLMRSPGTNLEIKDCCGSRLIAFLNSRSDS
uniref:Uncharacterized protein n=1 Tax=Oryza meridionalis TaxID=40149 RepID=A0A0E0F312_9ORYZ